jgi:hypothetical protein
MMSSTRRVERQERPTDNLQAEACGSQLHAFPSHGSPSRDPNEQPLDSQSSDLASARSILDSESRATEEAD